MTTLEQATAAARRLGRSAALRGTGITSCPYPVNGTPHQRAAARAWMSEYLQRRPGEVSVDYTGDLEAIAAGGEPGPDGMVDGVNLNESGAGSLDGVL